MRRTLSGRSEPTPYRRARLLCRAPRNRVDWRALPASLRCRVVSTLDPRRELRGATYQGDAAAVVAVLQTPEAAEFLQLGGDGLLLALDHETDGAAEIARTWIARLRERDWLGDDELAEQLAARLGDGPTPMLRPLPVDLEELSTVLEGDPLNGDGRLDLRNGEVWPHHAIEYVQEEGKEDESEAPYWLPVRCEGSRSGYRDMQMFADSVTDEKLRDRLDRALQGRGAFRRFRDILADGPDGLGPWHDFFDERHHGRARAWLADAGYRVGPAAERDER
jgi:hypothetical protein